MELEKAKNLALGHVEPLEKVWVPLEDALGRVLSEPVHAGFMVPGEARSRFDGFAVRSSDTIGATSDLPVCLRVLPGILAAGHMRGQPLEPGKCVRILTGAPLPSSADSVVLQENTTVAEGMAYFSQEINPAQGVSQPGEDIGEGDLLLGEGELLTPTRLALVAALGKNLIPVHRRPKVALLATGDEIREPGEYGQGPVTFCNNRLLLSWLVTLYGGEPVQIGVACDETQSIVEHLQDVQAELCITTGGIGRGDRDYVLAAWNDLGIRPRFREINLSPGKNSAMGIRGNQMFWALPGNPWGAQIVFEEMVSPVLRRLQGMKKGTHMPSMTASLEVPLKNRKGIHKAVRGILKSDPQTRCPVFKPVEKVRGAFFAMLRDSFAYTILEPHVLEVAKGSRIEVRLHDFPLMASPIFETLRESKN